MEQWEIDKRLREYHGRVFLEELFEGSLKLKRYVPPEVTGSEEPVMPLTLIPSPYSLLPPNVV